MNAWIDPQWSSAVNHALLHSIWQCAATAAALWLVLRMMHNPRLRYAASLSALLIATAWFGVTLVQSISVGTKPTIVRLTSAVPIQPIWQNKAEVANHRNEPKRSLSELGQHASMLWIAGIGFLSLYHLSGWRRLRIWKNEAELLADSSKTANWQRLAQRLGIAWDVPIAQSRHVTVPSVVGLWRPMILLPFGILTDIDPLQLDALIAHELAHLRRHDHWINLLQISLETLLFYHPAIWWISRQIRIERECCCDDLAASVCGDRRTVAEALSNLAAKVSTPSLVLAATDGPLLHRVRRLLVPAPRRSRRPMRNWLAALLPLSLALAGGMFYQHANVAHAQVPATQPVSREPTSRDASSSIESDLMQRLAIVSQRLTQMQLEQTDAAATLPAGHPKLAALRQGIEQTQSEYNEIMAAIQKVRSDSLQSNPTTQPDLSVLAAAFAQAQLDHIQFERQYGADSPEVRAARIREEDARHLYRRAREGVAAKTGQQTLFYMSGVKEPGAYSWADRPITLPEALLFGGMWTAKDPTILVYRRATAAPTTIEAHGDVVIVTQPNSGTTTPTKITADQIKVTPASDGAQEPIKFTAAEALGEKGRAFVIQSDDSIVVADTNETPVDSANEYYIGGDAPRAGAYSLQHPVDLLQALIAAGVDVGKNRSGTVTLHRLHARDNKVDPIQIEQLLSGERIAIGQGDQIMVKLPHGQ